METVYLLADSHPFK